MDRSDYIKKYKKIYKNIKGEEGKKAEELIERLADVLCMMDECKQHITEEGCVTEMCQGKYFITRENPWSSAYNGKAKIMLAIIDKLEKMLPKESNDADELLDFIKR